MIRTLIKKQLFELNSSYFIDRKTGKRRSRGKAAGYITLFVVLILFLAVFFGGMALLLAQNMINSGMDWLFFAIMGLMALAMGVFGSVFNTYVGLYQGKDNDMLLSMPIPPAYILLSRMVGVYAMAMLYSGMVYLPAAIVYWFVARPGAAAIVFSLLLLFLLGAVVVALTCALGYLVALVAGKLKHRSIVSVLATLAFLGVYYFCYFKLNSFMQYLISNAASVGEKLRIWAWPFYAFGMGAAGNGLYMLLFTLIALGLLALTVWVMSKSFMRLATAASRGEKQVSRKVCLRPQSLQRALLQREWKRFINSPAYMLNGGLGVLLMPIGAVAVLLKGPVIRQALEAIGDSIPTLQEFVPAVAVGVVCLIASMNIITAPSVSLEGRQLWILRAAPVSAKQVLRAKSKLHMLLTGIPAMLCLIACWIALRLPWVECLIGAAAVLSFIWLWAEAGLLLDLRNPNLNWTSEIVPIKQNMSAMICLFGSWVLAFLLTAGGFMLEKYISCRIYLLLTAAVLGVAALLLHRRLLTKGAARWEAL